MFATEEKYGDKIEIAPPFNTPIEAKSYIANMDVLLVQECMQR
jgi:hypothetical protein